jgi:hypothetical protein
MNSCRCASLAPNSIDTVFIGDSSLGNGISAPVFDAATGTHSVSLALTGNFGFGGGLGLLERLAGRQPIQNVVLVYSIEAMATGAAHSGYFFVSPYPFVEGIPWANQLDLLSEYASRLLNGHSAATLVHKWLSLNLKPDELATSLYADDYVISPARVDLGALKYSIPRRIKASSATYLTAIARLCAVRKWNCLYAHGPVLAQAIIASPQASTYLTAANALICAQGISVISGSPVLLADAERGDTVFHTHIDSRAAVTQRYAELLRPRLRLPHEGLRDRQRLGFNCLRPE